MIMLRPFVHDGAALKGVGSAGSHRKRARNVSDITDVFMIALSKKLPE